MMRFVLALVLMGRAKFVIGPILWQLTFLPTIGLNNLALQILEVFLVLDLAARWVVTFG